VDGAAEVEQLDAEACATLRVKLQRAAVHGEDQQQEAHDGEQRNGEQGERTPTQNPHLPSGCTLGMSLRGHPTSGFPAPLFFKVTPPHRGPPVPNARTAFENRRRTPREVSGALSPRTLLSTQRSDVPTQSRRLAPCESTVLPQALAVIDRADHNDRSPSNLGSPPEGMFGSASVPSRPAGYTGDELTD
jgi:hypothetical protein